MMCSTVAVEEFGFQNIVEYEMHMPKQIFSQKKRKKNMVILKGILTAHNIFIIKSKEIKSQKRHFQTLGTLDSSTSPLNGK